MDILVEVIIPAVIILVSNIFSHEYESRRYEIVTAIFGYTAVIAFMAWISIHILSFIVIIAKIQVKPLIKIEQVSFQICVLSFVTALSRDYEKILKPYACFYEEKMKNFFIFMKRKIKRK